MQKKPSIEAKIKSLNKKIDNITAVNARLTGENERLKRLCKSLKFRFKICLEDVVKEVG